MNERVRKGKRKIDYTNKQQKAEADQIRVCMEVHNKTSHEVEAVSRDAA